MNSPASSWPTSKPVSRQNAAHQILEDVRAGILEGRYPRGSKLPTERELAETYQVSGPTVREAVRGLVASGLVEVRHGSGAYVTADALNLLDAPLRSMIRMEKVSVAELLGVLRALHAYAAELAASNATPAQIARLREDLAAVQGVPEADELSLSLMSFLSDIVEISANPLLMVLAGFLAEIQVDLARELSGGTYSGWRQTVDQMNGERQALVEAIASRDGAAARQAAARYHDKATSVITALTRNGGTRCADPLLASLLESVRQAPRGLGAGRENLSLRPGK